MEDFLIALAAWQEAKQSLNECYESCESSPGWYCRSYAEDEERARKAMDAALNALIDARVKEALATP